MSALMQRVRYTIQAIARIWIPALILAGLFPAQAQPAGDPAAQQQALYDFQAARQPVIPLDGQWRFHLGDDPDGSKQWASPAFDDSS